MVESINWKRPSLHYPARGRAPEIYATRLNPRSLKLDEIYVKAKKATKCLKTVAARLLYHSR